MGRNFFRFHLVSFLCLLVFFSPTGLEGDDLAVDLTDSTVVLTAGASSIGSAWPNTVGLAGGGPLIRSGSKGALVGATFFPLNENFAIRTYTISNVGYFGSPLAIQIDLVDLDFGPMIGDQTVSMLGVISNAGGLSIALSLNSNSIIFGPNNEYTMSLLGLVPLDDDPSDPETALLLTNGFFQYDLIAKISVVPEPDTYLLLGSLLALGALARRRVAGLQRDS